MARDTFHEAVVKALEKQGWLVSPKAQRIISGSRKLWIDIRALKLDDEQAVFVEVKTFRDEGSPVELLAHAVGQYALYRFVLDAADTIRHCICSAAKCFSRDLQRTYWKAGD